MNLSDPLSDEELLLLTRTGDNNAYTLLIRRFLGPSRKGDINRASPGILRKYSLWEISSVSLSTFWACMDGYRFGTVRFHTYYITSLRFNLNRFVQNKERERRRVASLDATFNSDNDFCLHDVLSIEGTMDDPKNFINYYETLNAIKKLPNSIPKETLDIAKMKANGLTFVEIAEAMKMTYRQVYSRYQQFLERAKKLIKKPN